MRNRKEEILTVALHLFARDGYEAVSVSQIAGELDMTKGALYRHYDGMEGSYYSVFVETDLNKASTIDGQRLSSEDAIAGYIASMLLLETDPVFYISYDGVYTTGGTNYYEFRCHR